MPTRTAPLAGGGVGAVAVGVPVSVVAAAMGVHVGVVAGAVGIPVGGVWTIEAARALTWQAARLCDRGRPFTAAAAMAKLVAIDTAMQVTSDADRAQRDRAGLRCGARLARLDRFFRDAKATQFYEGTNQIQRLVIARHALQPSAVSHQPSA